MTRYPVSELATHPRFVALKIATTARALAVQAGADKADVADALLLPTVPLRGALLAALELGSVEESVWIEAAELVRK